MSSPSQKSSQGPPAKKLKTSTSAVPSAAPTAAPTASADDSKLNEIYTKLDEVQEKIEKLNDEAAEEIVQIERKYAAKRQPIYKERNAVIKRIPNFWKTALMNHSLLIECFSNEDQEVLNYLDELEVEHYSEDTKEGYKIITKFKPNLWFKNTTFTKEIIADDANPGRYNVVSSKVDWKEGKDLTQRAEEDQGFFFMWFAQQDVADDALQEVSGIISQDLWESPAKYYHGLNDVEEEGEEVEEEGEDGEEQ